MTMWIVVTVWRPRLLSRHERDRPAGEDSVVSEKSFIACTVATTAPAVVGHSGDLGVVRRQERRADLLLEEDPRLLIEQDAGATNRRYGGPVSGVRTTVARAREPLHQDVSLALVLTVAGVLEVLLGPTPDDGRWVSALVLPFATLPLAWRRELPLLPVTAVAAALAIQAPLDGFLVGHAVTPLIALAIALYSAGRHAGAATALAGALSAGAVIAATRIAFDPGVENLGDAVMTLVVVPLPLLLGRWVRGQVLLQRELRERSERLERERERDARRAAEDERMRIATDLQAAVAKGLGAVVHRAQELPGRLAAGDHAAAHALLASIACTAREALGDVRRVLGVLRHDGQPPRLAPPVADPFAVPDAGPDTVAHAATDAGPAEPAPPERDRRWWLPLGARAAPWLDRLLVAALFVGAEIELALVAPAGDRVVAALIAVPIVIPLLWRRLRPVPVALAVLGAIAVQSAAVGLDAFPVADTFALICASYAIGAHLERRAAVAGLGLVALGVGAHAAVFYPEAVAAALLGGAAFPWTVGITLRSQRRLTDERHGEAARIERVRAREAQAAVTSERMRVARELHDAVAHSISVIAIQAGGADGIVERDPARAAQVATLIETVGRDALAELGRLLDPLGGDGADAGAPAPPPGLARVDALAERARGAGLPVDLHVEGDRAALPAGVDLAAFRIVQEALANTSQHAGAARAWVVVRYGERAVEVEVADDGRGANGGRAARDGRGHGLAGMRERVALYGGTLDVGRRPSGGFRVRARLPIGRA